MSKINTSALLRPPPVTESRIVTDALRPGEELSLTLTSRPDYGEALSVQSLSARYTKEFAGHGKVPIQIKDAEGVGHDIEISDKLCICIAIIQTLEQPQEDGTGRYSFEDWAIISAGMPNAFGEVVEWAEELMAKATAPKKKSGDGEIEIPNG